MCGIFSIIFHSSETYNDSIIKESFKKGSRRGPEFSTISYVEKYNSIIGFHRLAINGLNEDSNQPLIIGDISLICNGEIYNYKELYQMMNIKPTTGSDCEVIIHLYIKYGIEQTLRMLDGVFAFVLYTPEQIYIARDPYGVRPLYYAHGLYNERSIIVASELKSIIGIYKENNIKISHFPPGHYEVQDLSLNYTKNSNRLKYHSNSSVIRTIGYNEREYESKLEEIYNSLKLAVFKRCSTTERPIACLLSGGLDSSLIASLVNLYMKENGLNPVETYSIGLPNSEDIKYAEMVAEHIGSNHTEIIVSEDDMYNAIPEVIEAIESYDTTTIRASIGNYLIGKYIKQNSEAKVIFNGDGSDELCGGYLYMHKCPDDVEFDKETIRLLEEIYLFDVTRSDKSISSHGLEPRTPFLDKNFVNTYLSIPVKHRRHLTIEKFMLREAFSHTDLLPTQILWRKKEAFSDGVSNHGRSLYQIIQDRIRENKIKYDDYCEEMSSIDMEKEYYFNIFDSFYPGQRTIIPHYWMPKYTNTNDPSARTLEHYNPN
jgi:asparagine synthase (glutamine-hydrolysing)